MLKVENLTYRKNSRYLIKDITLSLQPGVLYGVLGANGSGKSTLLRCLCGLWKASRGSVLWKEENLLDKERKEISRLITLVLQHVHTPFGIRAEDFVRMGRYCHNRTLSSVQDTQVIKQAFELVGAVSLRQREMNSLSQGERQRIILARALATEAPIFLLDEPSSNLDVKHREEMWRLLDALCSQGKIVVVANHDLDYSRLYCGEVILLKNGKCKDRGCPSQILTDDAVQNFFDIGTSYRSNRGS